MSCSGELHSQPFYTHTQSLANSLSRRFQIARLAFIWRRCLPRHRDTCKQQEPPSVANFHPATEGGLLKRDYPATNPA